MSKKLNFRRAMKRQAERADQIFWAFHNDPKAVEEFYKSALTSAANLERAVA